MKCPLLFVLLVSSALPLGTAAAPAKQDFEADAVGRPPAGFVFARTGGGAEGTWVVRIEKGADKRSGTGIGWTARRSRSSRISLPWRVSPRHIPVRLSAPSSRSSGKA